MCRWSLVVEAQVDVVECSSDLRVILRIELPGRRGKHANRKSRRHTTIYEKKSKRVQGPRRQFACAPAYLLHLCHITHG